MGKCAPTVAIASGFAGYYGYATGYFSADVLSKPSALAYWPSDIGDVNMNADVETNPHEFSQKWLDYASAILHSAAQANCNPGNLSGCERKRGRRGLETNTTDNAWERRNNLGNLEFRRVRQRDDFDTEEFRQLPKRTDDGTLQPRQLQIIIDIVELVMDFLGDPVGAALRSLGANLSRSTPAEASEDVDGWAEAVAEGKPNPISIAKNEGEAVEEIK